MIMMHVVCMYVWTDREKTWVEGKKCVRAGELSNQLPYEYIIYLIFHHYLVVFASKKRM